MTAKSMAERTSAPMRTDRQAMTEAREVAEMLVAVVGLQTPAEASVWLLDQLTSIGQLANVALVLASMVPPDPGYDAHVRERFQPPRAAAKK